VNKDKSKKLWLKLPWQDKHLKDSPFFIKNRILISSSNSKETSKYPDQDNLQSKT
jgi:hypothetical protein